MKNPYFKYDILLKEVDHSLGFITLYYVSFIQRTISYLPYCLGRRYTPI